MNDPKTIEAVANLVAGDNTYFNEYHKYLASLKAATVQSMINAPADDLQLIQGACRMIDSLLNDLAQAPVKSQKMKLTAENTRNGST